MTNTTTRPRSFTQKLHAQLTDILAAESNSIRAYVAQEALDYCDVNPAQMFIDLSNAGCQCGTISSLIYYVDTYKFFDRYYDDIENMREEFEDSTGEPLQIKGDLKNWLA